MAGISILIVDDDKILVEKLEDTLHWNDIGISMVFTALNIRQAREVLEQYSIQILLCDIDMPQGNGLELVEWIREKKFPVEVVFLSSYANFAYAQMALKLSSRDYLLKPISNANLERALSQVVDAVSEKMTRRIGERTVEKQRYWQQFLNAIALDEAAAMPPGGNDQENDRFCLAVIRTWINAGSETYRKELFQFENALRNHAEEFQKRYTEYMLEAIVRLGDQEWTYVLRFPAGYRIDRELVFAWKRALFRGIPHPAGVYMGRITAADGLAKSLATLRRMEKYALLNETGVLFEDRWVLKERIYHRPEWETWKWEMRSSENLPAVEEQILAFMDRQKEDGWRRDTLRLFIREFRQMVSEYLGGRGSRFGELFEEAEYEEMEYASWLSIQMAKNFICYVFERLKRNASGDNRQENVVDQLKTYIERHLGEDLSRSVLARQVYLSEDYVSKLFARSVGTSLPNYIAMRRIEKAKDYLVHSALPVSRIAIEVGYGNFSYFSKTFRSQTGCTPNEFRAKWRRTDGADNRNPQK